MKLEVRTEIRGRDVGVTWDGQRLSGDPEFLQRVRRFADLAGVELDATDEVTVADLCRRAIPAPIQLRVTDTDGLVGS